MAHRDDSGLGAGANDNASGTGALIELARAYATPAGSTARAIGPEHPLLFLSTDGGAFGGLGAARFAEHYPDREPRRRGRQSRLDRRPRHGRGSRSPATSRARPPPALVETAVGPDPRADRLRARPNERARPADRPRLPVQPVRAGGRSSAAAIPAVTLTTGGDRPPPSFGDTPGAPRAGSASTEIGRATHRPDRLARRGPRARPRDAQLRLPRQPARPRLDDRARAGRDAAAVRRRRGRPVRALPPAPDPGRTRHCAPTAAGSASGSGPARCSCSSRSSASGPAGPRDPSTPRRARPATGRYSACCCSRCSRCPAWLVSRSAARAEAARRPRRRSSPATRPRCSRLGVVALLVVATNPFALLFLLPSLHIWLWLPQVRNRGPGARLRCSQPGCVGPFILLGSFMFRFGLGLDAPWYLAELVGDQLRLDRGAPPGSLLAGRGRTADWRSLPGGTRRTRPPPSGRRAGRSATPSARSSLDDRRPPPDARSRRGRRGVGA